jgi:hypothetical protein
MHQANCLNCETALQGGEIFCPNCGQKTNTHRLTWHHFIHEAWHAFTHTDKGILNLLKGLATNPGLVISEYVGGKHKKYFNPITFLLLCLGLFVVANSIIKPYVDSPKPDPQIVAQLKTEKERKMYFGFFERVETSATIQQKHPNILAMFGLPLEAFIFWLFFRHRGRNYVEFLIAVIFLGGFSYLIFTFSIGPLLSQAKSTSFYNWILIGVLLIMASYSAWGMKGFLTNPRPIQFWKPLLVAILHNVVWLFVSVIFFLWYVLRDHTLVGIKKYIENLK